MPGAVARERANAACQARNLLVIIEGGEVADGLEGRIQVQDFLKVLSPQNRWLLLTRDSTQAAAAECVTLDDVLGEKDAADLLDSLLASNPQAHITPTQRTSVLRLLAGHPLALSWAGNLLARGDEAPDQLVTDW